MPRHDPDQKTKQHILETAERLFTEKGLENVNVEDVVKEVGVTRELSIIISSPAKN